MDGGDGAPDIKEGMHALVEHVRREGACIAVTRAWAWPPPSRVRSALAKSGPTAVHVHLGACPRAGATVLGVGANKSAAGRED